MAAIRLAHWFTPAAPGTSVLGWCAFGAGVLFVFVDSELHGADRLRRWSIVLTALGALDALYLTYLKLAHAQAALCPAGGGCDTVNASPYSQVAGIPIALLGLLAYLAILVLLLLDGRAKILSSNDSTVPPRPAAHASRVAGDPVAGVSRSELSGGAEYLRLAVFGLSLSGVLYSGYLTYLELFVLHAICPYCVLSALLLLALLTLSVLRLRSVYSA